MRILFTRFPLESRFGGAEVQTLSLMEGLIKGGDAVAFMGSCPVLINECRRRKIPVVELDIGPPPVTPWTSASFAWRQYGMQEQLLKALESFHGLDAVCMLSLSEKILATDALAVQGKNVVWIEHDRVGRWLRNNPWLGKLRNASQHATTVVVSELSRKIYADLGWDSKRTVVIPNGIDLKRLDPPPHPQPRYSGETGKGVFRIGTVARLTKDKGVDALIDAVKNIPDVQLTIIGDGPERETLNRRISRILQYSNPEYSNTRILVIDHIADLGGFYRSLDLFVLPSREHDPFGLVAAEAVSLGVPTIVTDACGIADILIKESLGIVVPANSSGALREAIIQMKDNQELRRTLSAHGKAHGPHLFSVDTMVKGYRMCWSDVIRN